MQAAAHACEAPGKPRREISGDIATLTICDPTRRNSSNLGDGLLN